MSPETPFGPLPATSGQPRPAPSPPGPAAQPANGPANGSAPPPGPGPAAGPGARTPTATSPGLATPGMPGPASAPVPSDRPTEAVHPASPPVPAEAVAGPPLVEGPAPAPGGRLCHGSGACRRLLILGGVAGGLGLGAIATGVALLARPLALDPEDPTALVTYRPAGAALLAVGAGLAATWLLTLLAARKAGRLAQRLRAAVAVP
ncbi:hypothetical protein [Nannocystis bainbridge]|uniref:Uncharacterized protein n=1 Tax=Nannocystis bainbridge TaxID=2995303 RepID=A0ABT5DQY4_9BACT|nr:hypothetical protein [Nannocystis bainbridge]MDC0716066.1 hypothetical protein [Nannocystis bainbridge]